MVRRRTDRRGNRTLRRPDMRKQLVDITLTGAPVTIVANSVGISPRTLQDWMQRGLYEDDRLADLIAAGEENPTPDKDAKPFLDLFRDLTGARAKAAIRNVGYVQRVAQGGFVTEETTKTYRDADGNKVEETSIKRASPDWRAAAWFLERTHGQQFGKDATQVEIIGGGSGQGEVQSGPAAEQLAARIAANIEAATLAIEAGQGLDVDVVEAEIVED